MLVQFGNNWIQKIPLTAKLDSSRELRQGSGLYVMFWTFLLNLVFVLKTWHLIVYLYVKYFFPDNLLDLSGHVTDHALN